MPLLKSCLVELGFDDCSARGAEEPKPSKPTWAEKAGGPCWTNKAFSDIFSRDRCQVDEQHEPNAKQKLKFLEAFL